MRLFVAGYFKCFNKCFILKLRKIIVIVMCLNSQSFFRMPAVYAYDIRLRSLSLEIFQTMLNEFYEITYMYSASLLFIVSKCYW